MDLVAVKATVKAWEKAFRAREGRDPTKEDIKRDPGDIAQHYALYRKLAKSGGSSSQSQSHSQRDSSQSQALAMPPPSSSTAGPSSSASSQYRSTPRNIPSSEYPTTPTPPSRRAGGRDKRAVEHSSTQGSLQWPSSQPNGEAEADKRLKRKASQAALTEARKRSSPPAETAKPSSTTARSLFSTPKKKAYTGPIHDPNPVNPFTISPRKTTPLKDTANGRSASFESPFIHASSPRKLKEVLEANSLRKVKEREGDGTEVTPRTRARKRLRGEPVEDTPVKDKQPRRKRGESSRQNAPSSEPDLLGLPSEGLHEDEEEEEDELGPSPMKGLSRGKGFASLFGEAGFVSLAGEKGGTQERRLDAHDRPDQVAGRDLRQAPPPKRGRPSEMMGLFGRLGKSTIQAKTGEAVSDIDASVAIAASVEELGKVPEITIQVTPPRNGHDIERISPPIPASPTLAAAEHDAAEPGTPAVATRRKVLTLSDDEADEWDPEGGHVQREVTIVPTRRQVTRRESHSDLDEPYTEEAQHQAEAEASESDEEGHAGDQVESPLERRTNTQPGTPNGPSVSTLPLPMLNLLSLRSPSKSRAAQSRARVEGLRVKAIFDPAQASQLRAIQRGQEVSFTGESRGVDVDDPEDLLERYEFGLVEEEHGLDDAEAGEGDDDWEEESDGWKREQVEEDW
ncbi:hypothetical protein IAU60_000830 [Kwoniella sp. DSM 27419]